MQPGRFETKDASGQRRGALQFLVLDDNEQRRRIARTAKNMGWEQYPRTFYESTPS
jgi:hypothetical protein